MLFTNHTQIYEPGSREYVACTFPVPTDPVLNVGDILYLGSGKRRVRVTEVEYVLNLEKAPDPFQAPRASLAGRNVYTAEAPLG